MRSARHRGPPGVLWIDALSLGAIDGVVVVVDGALGSERVAEHAALLQREVLRARSLRDVPLLVLANKQDLQDRAGAVAAKAARELRRSLGACARG